MSKLDRQVDEFFGESRVQIHWPCDDEVDVELLRLHLISEIDAHQQRVPLDLRGVNGAPDALVDLLLEMQRYAMSQSKVLSISASLPPMQEALSPRRGPKKKSEGGDRQQATASDVAMSTIKGQRGGGDPQLLMRADAPTQRQDLKRKRRNSAARWNSYLKIALAILFSTAGILVLAWIFNYEEEPLIYRNVKNFESQAQEISVQVER